jgi:hypothetical protein
MPLATLTALKRREITYVIDTATMKIIQKYVGSTDGSGTPSTATARNYILTLIGPKGG